MARADGVLFCGGGTGGHVHPGLAVAAALRERGERRLRWIGDPARIEARLVPAAGIPLLPFGLSRPRPTSLRWLIASAKAALRTAREFAARPPRAVVALGGYAALLPGLMAALARRPLIVLEQNARAGRTNRLLARFAARVVTQFPEAREGLSGARVVELGNPVRAIRPLPRGRAAKLRVLVVGGSLAARTLNDVVLAAAARLSDVKDLAVTHLAGEDDRARAAGLWVAAGIEAEVMGFCDDMPALYERIDVAVTRAGATTVAELCAAGIPALYVPLPWSADDHQTANARAVERVGGAAVVAQRAEAGVEIAALIERWCADRAIVERMGRAARTLARPDAATRVAELVAAVDRQDRRARTADRRHGARSLWRRTLRRRDGEPL
ncbi:MAG TPA: UDP-N-acetylglucosamine--N-acetylmuramyl-(pentapeptide) pyrophosphoryl-undecaprenol N-acetylglucosamine transferase [Planctomycetota bacterium]|nr:UDP-N-acetylglucosamine--N-acetylmuramyl-(pentapeptide) pyrophosphoryl-undecaprenol N-acetylglucosamine transferase [Planctomycetota bacterium]